MKILYVNCVCGVGSTGRIVTDLMKQEKELGHTVKVACSTVEPIKNAKPEEVFIVGSKTDYYIHNILSRLTDHEGLFSKAATKKLIRQVEEYAPDIVHLHNLHGHWINYELLFQYLAKENKKVIWTLHDCWAFTGHCTYFSVLKCRKWETQCSSCPGLRTYPACYCRGDVTANFFRKKKAFTSVGDLTIVTPSQWLADLVAQSYLNGYPVSVVHNKIDLSVFKPTKIGFREKYKIADKTVVLGVSNVWNREKGYDDFLALSNMMDNRFAFVMVGLTKQQIESLPERIIGIERTHDAKELAGIYSEADVFVNLTYQDNYPSVNLEAIACGTPVVSYLSGGSCEAFDEKSGVSVAKGAIELLPNAINKAICLKREDVLHRAEVYRQYGDYAKLYNPKNKRAF